MAAFLSVVLITEMLEICIQKSYDQNVQLNLKSYLPVVYGTPIATNNKRKVWRYQSGNRKKDKMTNNGRHNTTQKLKIE
jgi:hypothetical protein